MCMEAITTNAAHRNSTIAVGSHRRHPGKAMIVIEHDGDFAFDLALSPDELRTLANVLTAAAAVIEVEG